MTGPRVAFATEIKFGSRLHTPTWPFLAKRPGGLTVMIRTTLLDLVHRARLRDWKKPTTLSVWTFELELY